MMKDPEPALTEVPDSLCLDMAKTEPKCVLDRCGPAMFADPEARDQKLLPSAFTVLLTQ